MPWDLGKIHWDNDYTMVINAVDTCAHTSRETRTMMRIPWQKWERFTTVIKTVLSVMKTTTISGCQLFAMMKGFSWTFVKLLWIYDFSPGMHSG
jgi:hypothetical protein